jgi:hypothetical protein
VVRYIEKHVLGQKDTPDGVYNAGLRRDAAEPRVAAALHMADAGRPPR